MKSAVVENPFSQLVTFVGATFNTSKNFLYHHVDDVCEDTLKLSVVTGASMIQGSVSLRLVSIFIFWVAASGPSEYIGDQVEYMIKGENDNEPKPIFKLPNIGDAAEDISKVGMLAWNASTLLTIIAKQINVSDGAQRALSVLAATKCVNELVQNYIAVDDIGDNAGKWTEGIVNQISQEAHDFVQNYIVGDDIHEPFLSASDSNKAMVCLVGNGYNSTNNIDS